MDFSCRLAYLDCTFLFPRSRVFVQCHLLDGLQRFTELFLFRLCTDVFCPPRSQLQVQVVFSVAVNECVDALNVMWLHHNF